MLTDINPKLPMRNKAKTRDFYLNKLGFQEFGSADFDGYLMVKKDKIKISTPNGTESVESFLSRLNLFIL